jgi:RimJ/RimL family protein N-acetyltransferase
VERVCARVDPANDRSRRLLERIGFAPDGERGGLRRFVLA